MSDNNIKKAPNDVLKVTCTCTISKYNISTVNRKKDNTAMRICNASAYVVTSNGLKNIRLVIYNERYINLFEKYSQEGTKMLIFGQIAFREYEKDGIKHGITEFIIGDRDEMITIRLKRKDNAESDTNNNTITNNNIINNNFNKQIIEEDLEEFDFSEFLDDK